MKTTNLYLDMHVNSYDANMLITKFDSTHTMANNFAKLSDIWERTGTYKVLRYAMQNNLLQYVTSYKSWYNTKYSTFIDEHPYRRFKTILLDPKVLSEHFNMVFQPVTKTYNIHTNLFTERFHNEVHKTLRAMYDRELLHQTEYHILCTYFMKMSEQNYTHDYDRHYDILSTGEFTYLPKNKPTIIKDSNKWLSKHRQKIKYAKAMRKILEQCDITLNDQFYENFHNILYSQYNFADEIRIVTGDDIRTYYDGNLYANISVLRNSCMRYNECQKYFDIYTTNPQVSMAVSLDKDNKVSGRALLWQCIHEGKKVTLMDRIYSSDLGTQKFKDFAHNNNFYHKKNQTYTCDIFVAPNGSTISDLRVNLDNTTFNYYPYMDTFKYLNTSEHYLTTRDKVSTDLVLECTNGSHNYSRDNDDWVDDIHGNQYHIDDVNYSDLYDCYLLPDDCVYSEYHETYLPNDDAVYCEDIQDYLDRESEDYVYIESCQYYILHENATYSEYEDVYYHNDYRECPVHGYVGDDNCIYIEIPADTDTTRTAINIYIHTDVTPRDLVNAFEASQLHTHLTQEHITYIISNDLLNE